MFTCLGFYLGYPQICQTPQWGNAPVYIKRDHTIPNIV